jgi:hypothetical protein
VDHDRFLSGNAIPVERAWRWRGLRLKIYIAASVPRRGAREIADRGGDLQPE